MLSVLNSKTYQLPNSSYSIIMSNPIKDSDSSKTNVLSLLAISINQDGIIKFGYDNAKQFITAIMTGLAKSESKDNTIKYITGKRTGVDPRKFFPSVTFEYYTVLETFYVNKDIWDYLGEKFDLTYKQISPLITEIASKYLNIKIQSVGFSNTPL